MSSKALIVALLILGLLAGAVMLLPKLIGGASPVGSQNGAMLLPIDLAELVSIELSRDGQVESRAQRTDAGGWVILDSQQRQWPGALTSGVRQALTSLSQVESQDDLAFASPAQGSLVFRVQNTIEIRLEFAQASLGGRRVVRSGSRVAIVEERVLRQLIDPGPISWRRSAAIPGVRRASRIELVRPDGSLELAKLSGRWRLRQPIGVSADERAVSALFDALASLSARQFLDDVEPDPSSAGLVNPRLVITYETDRRLASAESEVRIETVRQELHIGGPASASGDTLYARASGRYSAWMLVDAAGIAAISTAPRNYIEPTITGVIPSDVFRITLRKSQGKEVETYRRSPAGWIDEQPGGSSTASLERRIRELLDFLTSQPGEPEISSDQSDLDQRVVIELGDLNGEPLEIISAGYTPDGVLGFRSEKLLMLFDDSTAPELLGMSNGPQ